MFLGCAYSVSLSLLDYVAILSIRLTSVQTAKLTVCTKNIYHSEHHNEEVLLRAYSTTLALAYSCATCPADDWFRDLYTYSAVQSMSDVCDLNLSKSAHD